MSIVKKVQSFGILLDKATDNSVKNQTVYSFSMMILSRREQKFHFFVADVLENSISTNSETLHKVVLRELSVLGDDVS